MHYQRWHKFGDPEKRKQVRNMPLLDRFFLHVDIQDCWIWTSVTINGYGAFGIDNGATAAHRWLWKTLVGPIADGLQLDHLCRNPPCVNPDHLEPVTGGENVRRGATVMRARFNRRTRELEALRAERARAQPQPFADVVAIPAPRQPVYEQMTLTF